MTGWDTIISLLNESVRAHGSKVTKLLKVTLDIDPVVPHHKARDYGK